MVAGDPTKRRAARTRPKRYNESRYLVGNVRLHIESMDADGDLTAQTFRWVFGDVPAGGRTDFVVPELPTAAGYRVTVIWFDRVTLTRP
jgi:hypothetical protein